MVRLRASWSRSLRDDNSPTLTRSTWLEKTFPIWYSSMDITEKLMSAWLLTVRRSVDRDLVSLCFLLFLNLESISKWRFNTTVNISSPWLVWHGEVRDCHQLELTGQWWHDVTRDMTWPLDLTHVMTCHVFLTSNSSYKNVYHVISNWLIKTIYCFGCEHQQKQMV